MKVTTPKTITKELLGDDAPDWVDPIVDNLQAIGPIVQALQGGLSFPDNHNAQVKTVTVTIPDPTWTAVTFKNSWVDYNAGNAPVGYRIEPGGRVYIRGTAKSGTTTPGTVLFTLPEGYRPAYATPLTTSSNSALASVYVGTNGDVATIFGVNAAWVWLDMSFQAVNCAAPAPFSGNDWPLVVKTGIKGQAIGVQLLQAQDTGTGTSQSLGAMSLDWENTGNGQIRVRSVYGLQPGRTYKLTLLILGP